MMRLALVFFVLLISSAEASAVCLKKCGGGGGAETNDLEATDPPNVANDEMYMGSGAGAGVWIGMPTGGTNGCDGAGEALQYNTSTNAWDCITGLGAGGTVDSIVGDDNANATTGSALSIDGGVGISTDTAAASDVLIVTFDATEVDGEIWGNGTSSNWDFNVGATDPRFAFSSDSLVITNVATLTVPNDSWGDAEVSDTLTCSVIDLEAGTVTSIADTEILVGVGAGDASYVLISGDATLANTGALTLAANSVDSAEYTDASIDLAHMSSASVDSDNIVDNTIAAADMADNSINSDDYVDASIDLAHMSSASVDSDNIVDATIVEADIDGDEAPTDNDILTFDSTGANFSWQTPAELSLQPLDSELTTIAALTETNGNVMFVAGGVWTSDPTPAIDCSDCTSVPAGAWMPSDPSSDQSMTMTEHASDFLYDTPTTAAADDYFLLSVDYDATTDSGEQNILTVRQIDGGTDATGTIEALLLLESIETTADDGPVAMLEIRATTAGTAPIAIDLTDATIATAIALGANDITTAGATLVQAEIDLLDATVSNGRTDEALCTYEGTEGELVCDVDTAAELETALGSINVLLETEIDASSEMLALMDDETGTGLLVFATDPVFTTPNLGTPSALVLTNATGTIAGTVDLTAGMVDAGDYAADSVDHDDLNDTITFEDGTLLDFGTNISTTDEGLHLPAHATSCASATSEGQVCWEEDAAALWIGDGATAQQMNGAAPATEVRSMYWGAGAMNSDGTQCADPAEATINSGPKMWTIICTDNDASIMHGTTTMPDGWNAGTVTFEVSYIQTAADTNVLNLDIAAQCRNNGTVVNSTYGTKVAIDDAAVVGSSSVDTTTSGAVTANGTCAAGDFLAWQLEVDATGTTTAVATLHFIGVKMEFTTDIGD